MKILQIIPTLHTGGAEKFCIDLSNELIKRHEVTICTLFPMTKQMFLANKIDKEIKLISLDKQLGLDWKIFFKIKRVLQQEKPDIVHTHLSALFYTSLATLFSSYKFFHTIHNLAEKETNSLYQKIYSQLFKHCGVTPVAISDIVLESIQKRYGKQYSVKIENGTKRPQTTEQKESVKKEIEALKQNPHTTVFINIARIIPQKNQEMLVNVFHQLIAKERQNIILLIIGEDPTSEKVYSQKIKAQSCQGIHFLGAKKNIADYLACADAFCLSSEYEGLPITLLEAMAMGCLTISTPVGGIVDVITHNENGILAKDKNQLAYYDAIQFYLQADKEEKLRMQQKAKNDFNTKYTMEICAMKYEDAYRSKAVESHYTPELTEDSYKAPSI